MFIKRHFRITFSNNTLSKLYIHRFSTKTGKLDPYLILEINRNADWPTIKKSYFKLARQYHPDLNKNDERAKRKFILVKEAYEFFEKKYNPKKYENIKTNFSSFYDDTNEKKDEKASQEQSQYESIREKNKRKTNQNGETHNYNFKVGDSEDNFSFEEMENINKMNAEIQKQEYINKFLLSKMPPPRSYKMIDRLDLKSITLGKGKLFGPDDYMGFSLLLFFAIFLLMSRKKDYESNDFKNLEYVNIYNALKPAEIVKIYEENQKAPIEELVEQTIEFKKFEIKEKMDKVMRSTSNSIHFKISHDIPKADLKAEFKSQINSK